MKPSRLAACLLAVTALAPVYAHAEIPNFTVVAEDGRFNPETINVPANTRFRLTLVNKNAGPEEFETPTPLKELVVGPGVTRSTVYPPLKPGTYPFFGEFHHETAQGRFVAQ